MPDSFFGVFRHGNKPTVLMGKKKAEQNKKGELKSKPQVTKNKTSK